MLVKFMDKFVRNRQFPAAEIINRRRMNNNQRNSGPGNAQRTRATVDEKEEQDTPGISIQRNVH